MLLQRVERLESVVLEPSKSPRDEYATWVESKDADQYVGLYVAFVPCEGPIASAGTIKELKAKFKDHPLATKAAIVSVPNAIH